MPPVYRPVFIGILNIKNHQTALNLIKIKFIYKKYYFLDGRCYLIINDYFIDLRSYAQIDKA